MDGTVDGQIYVAKTLVISEGGVISGEIFAQHMIVNGEFEGTCHADKIEILSKGQVTGSLYSDDLTIEQGGRFHGVTYPSSDKNVAQLTDLSEEKELKNAAEG